MKTLQSPEWMDVVDSTNSLLAARVKSGEAVPGAVLAAVSQTAGRGRFDRRWLARPGANLTFSLFWQTAAGFPQVASAPLAAGLGVAEFLRVRHGIDARVKWPNDVMAADAKICGILSERVSPEPVANHGAVPGGIVVGIGVNINMTAEEAARIERPASSVLILTGRECGLAEELLAVLEPVEKWLGLWERGGFPALRPEVEKYAWRMGERVTVGDAQARREGKMRGFGESGELLLELPGGTISPCWSGDFVY